MNLEDVSRNENRQGRAVPRVLRIAPLSSDWSGLVALREVSFDGVAAEAAIRSDGMRSVTNGSSTGAGCLVPDRAITVVAVRQRRPSGT